MSLLWIPILILLFSLAYASASGAPWVPTFKRDIERIRRLLDLKDGEKFVELGCGDGRVVIALAGGLKAAGEKGRRDSSSPTAYDPTRLRPNLTGVELSIIQWLAAQTRRIFARSWNTRFVLGNAFAYDLRDADAVYLFLLPETYEKIRPKLEAELKPGARLVSFVWPIPDWNPEKVDEMPGAAKIYLYVR
ncbi:MAG: hypothetical protein WCO25_06305 [Candidatus Uhrbacteria bacterium]